ncbi:MAG TPA: spermine synthase, partial [Fibrobacteraceae bacterium]|nr:spermine synthase [Fibrobacteraceae bacterium]
GTGIWLGVALLTGLTSFVYEVVWIRLLSLMMGSSTHSFDQMVSAFILGLALGSLVSKRLLRRDALVMLSLAQVLMGAFALSTIYSHTAFFELMNGANLLFQESHWGFWGWTVFKYFLAVCWMVPTSFFAGMTLPFLTCILSRRTGSETPVGWVYGFNTFGSIVGSVVGGIFLIPALQLKWSLASAALVDMAIGLVLLFWYRPTWRTSPWLWGLLILVVLPLPKIEFDAHMVTAGVFRGHKDYMRQEQVWVANGRTATISFHENMNLEYIKTNGKPDASIRKDRTQPLDGDELTQAAIAYISMATRDQTYTAGMIGFGSGMCASYLLSDPLLSRLDVVEIEKEMLHLAQKFRPFNDRAFDDPRVHLYVDDARTFFHTHGQQYDLLLSIPSNPWVSGVSSLFSQEFYHHIRRYLNPGGVLVQWLQLYEFDNTLMLNILRALRDTFPYVSIYQIPGEPDVAILASDQPVRQTYIRRLNATDSIAAEFERMHRPWYYFGEQNFLATPASFSVLPDEVEPNSEYVPWVDSRAEMTRFAVDEVGITSAFDHCGLCWPALMAPQDYAPRKAFKDWVASRNQDPYLRENLQHQLRRQAELAHFPDTVGLGQPEVISLMTDSGSATVLSNPEADTLLNAASSVDSSSESHPRHASRDESETWHKIWEDMYKLIAQSPFSSARDTMPEFALMHRLVRAQLVPLEESLQFEFDDHLAHGRYRKAVQMLPALREVFVLGTMDARFQRDMTLCAFMAGDTRIYREIFSASILPSPVLDNFEKHLIARLLQMDASAIPLNSAVQDD